MSRLVRAPVAANNCSGHIDGHRNIVGVRRGAVQLGKNLLKIEMNEDAKIYEEELAKQSVQERKEVGITWYPLFIKSERVGLIVVQISSISFRF